MSSDGSQQTVVAGGDFSPENIGKRIFPPNSTQLTLDDDNGSANCES